MKRSEILFTIAVGTFILSLIGLYNGYPLVYSDTGMYILSGQELFVPSDRPVSYGLFIRSMSLNHSTWPVIIMQNLITAFVVFMVLKQFPFNKKRFNGIYLSILFFFVLFTGIGWYSNQLMPDFFVPLVPLILFLLLFGKDLSLLSRVLLSVILILSMITHFSHMLLGSVLMVIIIVLYRKTKKYFPDISLAKTLGVAIIVFSAWVIVPAINFAVERSFKISKGSHVFLMSHLVDTGILKKYLDEHCAEPDFSECRLCAFKDSLSQDAASFIWSSGILEKTGGWGDSKDEYNKIIYGTLKDPKYLYLNIYRSFIYGLVQLTDNKIGHGLTSYMKGSAPYGHIEKYFYNEMNNYVNSRQNKFGAWDLRINTINFIHQALILLSIAIVLLMFTYSLFKVVKPVTKAFFILSVLSILLNSFITAGLNCPYGRYQARIVWLLPLSVLLLVIVNFRAISAEIKKIKSSDSE